MTLAEKLALLKGKIKALAEKAELNEAEQGDLTKLMAEAKSVDMQIAAQAYAAVDPVEDQKAVRTQDGIEAMIDAAMKKAIEKLEKTPGLDAAGYMTNTGGSTDPKNKSFGDFLLAVKRGDEKRLKSVYGTQKTLEEDAGSSGGVLVPEEYHRDLLKMGDEANQVVALTTTVNVTSDAGSYPALDQFTAPTAGAGDTALAAGVKVTAKNESGTLDNNEPNFTEIKYRINKVGDLVYVSNELGADSSQSIETILRALFAIAIAAKKEFFVFRGSGAGEPLGILNSSAVVAVSPAVNNVFGYVDAATMVSRFKRYLSPARWFMHPSVFPDVATWEIGTAGAGRGKISDLGYGEPIFSEHLPQANNAGDVLLADLKAYLFFQRGGMTVDYSEHAAFTTDRVVWRVRERMDGMPWLKGTVTLADPQGSFTVSPFVYHND
jgi:HK97 family phage major capsid protein